MMEKEEDEVEKGSDIEGRKEDSETKGRKKKGQVH
jgi:hypothetical protein